VRREREQNTLTNSIRSKRKNLDLRKETVVAARPEEVLDGVVWSASKTTEIAGGAADGGAACGDFGEAVSHRKVRVQCSICGLTSVFPSNSAVTGNEINRKLKRTKPYARTNRRIYNYII